MLSAIQALPTDGPVESIHVVAFVDRQHVVMAWDQNERYLTTVGGRLEGGESPTEALDREAIEEAGVVLHSRREVFAAYRWPDSGNYTVFVVARVRRLVEMPSGYEKTGRVICSLETAADIVRTVESDPQVRLMILAMAAAAAPRLFLDLDPEVPANVAGHDRSVGHSDPGEVGAEGI
jgi:8-oxo-dGTP pyrophosphatase MutT (NUDIX family)